MNADNKTAVAAAVEAALPDLEAAHEVADAFPPRPDLIPDIVGVAELALRLGVRPNTIAVWRSRGQLLPPDLELAMGPVWLWERVEEWARATGKAPAA